MEQIRVNLNGGYDIYIGNGLSDISAFIKDSRKVMLISDENVINCCDSPLTDCKNAEVYTYIMSPGEKSKTLDTYREIIKALAENGFTREDRIIAFGGGVVGDVAAFAAATYLRGIRYISVPTSLLAMIDSSVGGKAAVNFDGYKNYIGAFYQPEAVFINTKYLKTLPENEFKNGLGEGFKYYTLIGEQISLPSTSEDGMLEDFIYKCLSFKAGIVEKDEKDNFERKLLNLGHTLGHAIEEDSDYTIPHGMAVANGVLMMAEAAFISLRMDESSYNKIENEFYKTGIERVKFLSEEDIVKHVVKDKKMASDGDIDAVLIYGLGDCGITRMSVDSFLRYVEKAAVYHSKNEI